MTDFERSDFPQPDLLAGHRRMRACLVGIRHLDPEGVARRVAEFDHEIARLETLFGLPPSHGAAGAGARIEFVRIGAEAPARRATAA